MADPGVNRSVLLVVEDDQDDQLLLVDALRAAGQAPTLKFVQDGQELLDYLSRPDLRRGSRLAGLYIVPFAGIAFIYHNNTPAPAHFVRVDAGRSHTSEGLQRRSTHGLVRSGLPSGTRRNAGSPRGRPAVWLCRRRPVLGSCAWCARQSELSRPAQRAAAAASA